MPLREDFTGIPRPTPPLPNKFYAADAKEHAEKINALELAISSPVTSASGSGPSSYPSLVADREVGYSQPTPVVTFPNLGTNSSQVPGGGTLKVSMAAAAGKVGVYAGRVSLFKSAAVIDGLSYMSPSWLQYVDGTSGVSNNPNAAWGIGFKCNQSRYINVVFGCAANPVVHVWMDDQKLTALPVVPGFPAGGGWQHMLIDLGAAYDGRTHRWRVMTRGCNIAAIYTTAAGNVWADEVRGKRVMYCGDSLGGIPGVPGSPGAELSSWFLRWATLSGYRDVWNATVGGTGFLKNNGNFSPYNARLTSDIAPYNPDVVILGSNGNDKFGGYTAAQVATAAATCLTTLGGMSSTPQVILFTMPDPNGVNGSDYTAYDDALLPVCAGKAALISLSQGKLWDFAGNLVMNDGPLITTANRTVFGFPSFDNVHGNDAFHEHFAQKMREYTRGLALAA